MLRRSILLSSIFISMALLGEPYKPEPILFIHGYTSNSKTWGAGTYRDGDVRTDSICKDSIEENSTYENFLPLMQPFAWAWYEWEIAQGDTPTYTPDPEADFTGPRFPNKCFLEVVNMDDPWGSVDDDYSTGYYISDEYTSWQDELYHRVKEVI